MVDSVGGEFEKNFTITIEEVNTTPPDVVVVNQPTPGALVSSPTTFSGACEIGAIVRLAHPEIDGTPAEVLCVDDGNGNGVYLIEDVYWSDDAASGEKTVVVTQEDPSGNVSESTNITIVIDVDVPVAGFFGPITRAAMKVAGHVGLWW